jgi:polygalacturonase
MTAVLKVLRDLRIETSERNNYSQSYAFGYTDAISDAIQAVKKLTAPDVVVPKGTFCECKKHSLKTNYGFEICTKCGNEFDD